MVVPIDEDGGLRVRSYDEKRDWARVEALERRCQVVGPSDRISIFIDSLGDPICRIRNSPSYNILVCHLLPLLLPPLTYVVPFFAHCNKTKFTFPFCILHVCFRFYVKVAELGKDLVGVIQGTVKVVAVHRPPPKDKAKTGYILGLRVSPDHRRRGVASALVNSLEQWFISNHIEFSYMATEETNVASVRLFVGRLGYVRFRTPSILVYPVNARRRRRRRLRYRILSNVEIRRLGTESAELVYRRFVSTSSDFFPDDIDRILKSRLNLGTWVAHFGDDTWLDDGVGSASWRAPGTWAMLSAWDTSQVFKLRLGKAPLSFRLFTRVARLINNNLPCLGMPAIPDFFRPFGFYFIYGVYGEGKSAGELIRALCRHVQRLAGESEDCRAVVTEVGETDEVGLHVPRWKLLSCPRDLWCMKPLKPDDDKEHVFSSVTRALFVDPREV